MDIAERMGHAYFFAKHYIINKGYGNEIDFQTDTSYKFLTQEVFINEMAWVIIASGMNDKIVRTVFPKIRSIMLDFKNRKTVLGNKEHYFNLALTVFNHPGKINAILFVLDYIEKNPFKLVKQHLLTDKLKYIQTFPYMGKATSLHFAKNIGIDVVKPDRHLVRISQALGYTNPDELCKDISNKVYEKVSVIDLVIWRYATLDKNYLRNINKFILK